MKSILRIVLFVFLFVPTSVWAEKSLDGGRFVYLGAFRLPSSIYSTDITFYPSGDPGGGGDGFPGSFFVFSGATGIGPAYQVSIPAPQISGNQSNLPEASILSGPSSIVCNRSGDQDRSGGIAYLPGQGPVAEKLYWNIYEYYNVDATDHNSSGWVDLNFSGCAGIWHYGPRSGDTYHSMKTEDFLFRIWDTDWADSVLGGRYLISGKTREAGVFGSGRGINLYAVAPYLSGNPPANGSTVSAQVLMHYPQPPDPGEMPGVGGDPPYRACDRFSGGAWVRVGNEDAVVIVGRKSLGPERYGTGQGGDCNNYQGYHCDPYEPRFWFLDPSDFEPVIEGTDDPWDVVPYAIYDPSGETYEDSCNFEIEWSGGAAFDYGSSLFYFVEPTGNDSRIIHVYRVNGGSENYTLTVTKAGAGLGTVTSSPAGINCGVDCQEVYGQGTTVQLSAVPDNGSYFAGWSGDADCSDGTVVLTSDRDCTATFELGTPPTYTLSLTKTGTGSGTVTSSPLGIDCGGDCQEDYDEGTIVQLTATPDADSVFAGWSGAADCSDGTVTMDADTSCAATFNEAPGALGLVAAYGLDEGSGNTAGDASGQGNGGTLNGATWTPQGYFGNALSFDGVNDMVTVPDAASLDLTTGMTLEAWVRPTALSGWRTALLKESGSGLAYSLYAHDNAPQPATYVYIGGDQSVTGSTTLPLNTWSHLAATYDGSTLRFYTNGQQVGSRNVSGAIQTTGNPLCIGGNTVWGEYFEGRIDEVRLYDRALSNTEIQQDMETPVGGPGRRALSGRVRVRGHLGVVDGSLVAGLRTSCWASSEPQHCPHLRKFELPQKAA